MRRWTLVGFLLLGAGVRAEEAPGGWRFLPVREEISPRAWVIRDGGEGYGLGLAGKGDRAVDGKWVRRVPVSGGGHVVFNARFQAKNVETPVRSVVASVLWFDGRGKQVERAEFPVSVPGVDGEGWGRLTGTYRVPEGATEAQLELRLRWAADGEVVWRDAEVKPTSAPGPRRVRVASVHHRPRRTKGPIENLEQFGAFIEESSRDRADIVCLPEGITVCGNDLKYVDAAEAIPGPSTEFLGKCAAKAKAYVVAGIYERDGKTVYNTSVLIGRDGKLVGKYRKVCLPREESDGGITPGTEYPVFDTDFGRVGMMICWDVSYPEVARALSARGAEMILMPIWGGNETLAKARAIENQVYVVASGYDFRTGIYDRAGEALARSQERSGVIYADLDLNERKMWPWLGDWRSRIWREGPARVE